MDEKNNISKNNTDDTNINQISFLKIEKLKRNSHALNLLLRSEDIIVGFNSTVFRGSQKVLNQNLKIEDNKIITIFRRETFFNVKVNGPLGIKLVEVGSDEANDLLVKTENYLKNIKDFNDCKEFEVYKGKNNFYDIIEVLDTSLLASLLPFIWFYHHRLYSPLFLLMGTFLLLGSIAWWLVLSAWVILTIYMSKGSMSLLRGYCLFQDLKPYMKIYAVSNKNVQEIIRSLDKKSNYRFPFISPPTTIEETENNKTLEDENLKATQAS